MEVLTVDEDVEKNYMPSQWSPGLKGVARMQRFLHLCEIQGHHNNLVSPVEHVSYGPDERQGLNIMRCGTDETVLVFVHGGFWLEGDRHMHNFIAHGLHLHNITAVTLGYRLASPGSGLDHCVEDVVRGVEKVQELFPSSSILLSGHSAGGHLIMVALPRLSSLRGIRKVFCVSGVYSIQDVANTTVGVQIGFNSDQVEKFTVSPHPCYDQIELHLIVGQFDPPAFRKQAEKFAHRLARKGFRKRAVLVIPGEDHFSIVENLFYEKSPLTMCFAGRYEARKKRSKL
ncbi:kynurenine formamidase [Galendromus occidentalis]|uniref:Kynurenine formamidase n=1 Tax=Galendromus occidentalis TaxID=34638 RepID=A0AAJ6QNP3_9ACAR|nr:kynurenine formamidase [Galendromus occidentalis]